MISTKYSGYSFPGLFSSEELGECPRLSSSLVNLPTYLHCDEPLPDEVINALSHNKAAHKLILEHFPKSILAKTISLEGIGWQFD